MRGGESGVSRRTSDGDLLVWEVPAGNLYRKPYSERVNSFVRRTGLILLAVMWLPQMLFARPLLIEETRVHGGSAAAWFAVQTPIRAAQLHEFRSLGFRVSLARISGVDPFEPCKHLVSTVRAETIWHPAPELGHLLRSWQFMERAALF